MRPILLILATAALGANTLALSQQGSTWTFPVGFDCTPLTDPEARAECRRTEASADGVVLAESRRLTSAELCYRSAYHQDPKVGQYSRQALAERGVRCNGGSVATQAATQGRMTMAMLDERHPGWRQTVNTREFESWYRSQPPGIQRLARSPHPEDASHMLDLFAQATASGSGGGSDGWTAFFEVLGAALEGYNAGMAARRNAPPPATYSLPRRISVEAYTRSEECSSDYSCGIGRTCVKAPGHMHGTCMKTVDGYGLPTYQLPSPDSIGPRDYSPVCNFDTDCPIGFRCDNVFKACLKK